MPCGATSEVHFTLGTQSNNAQSLSNLQLTFEPALTCTPDAGQPDAGQSDAGSTVTVPAVPGKIAGGNALPAGCGCGAGGAPGLFGLVLLIRALRRRRTGR